SPPQIATARFPSAETASAQAFFPTSIFPISFPVPRSHQRSVRSLPAVASRLPLAEKADWITSSPWPDQPECSLPLATSHHRTVFSPPDQSSFPSEESATGLLYPACGNAGSSHSRTASW